MTHPKTSLKIRNGEERMKRIRGRYNSLSLAYLGLSWAIAIDRTGCLVDKIGKLLMSYYRYMLPNDTNLFQ